MPIMAPALADPEIAAAVFKQHLDALWATGRPQRLGWKRIEDRKIGDLHAVVKLPAKRSTGEIEPYYLDLGFEYYDAAPPTVAFVQPDSWIPAIEPSRWFPKIDPKPAWFGLASIHEYAGGVKKQLVCFSFTAEYYMTDHSPTESQKWKQGRHTVAATLFRLAELLLPPYYQRPTD